MTPLSRRSQLALAAVADIAIHARPTPVAAKALAVRLALPPRHLEALLQSLVHANILKGVRGPHGGYELARERRRVSVAAVLRAVSDGTEDHAVKAESLLVRKVITPLLEEAGASLLEKLETISIDDLCRQAEKLKLSEEATVSGADFTI
ncbi:MAG: Rrf2 family transcriptional regulator [Alphaproteobacteria bacterium]|nr:Rrf2 family transcriptional regulator [Alphaproteobacteria bacterium]